MADFPLKKGNFCVFFTKKENVDNKINYFLIIILMNIRFSVRQCSAYFGNCRKQQSMGSSCGWEKDYDYENCLNGYGYHLNDDACVARKREFYN